jgi:hypothetical protein
MEAHAIAVVRAFRRRLAQPERAPGPVEVVDRLASLPLDLTVAVPAQRPQQIAVERQAALDRGDDDVDVVKTCRAQ